MNKLGTPSIGYLHWSFSWLRDPSAPQYFMEPASLSSIDRKYVSAKILLIDFDEAFSEQFPPSDVLTTAYNYCSPELILEIMASKASDIQALACTIFQMRSGISLLDDSPSFPSLSVLEDIVRILGLPLEPPQQLWTEPDVCFRDLTPLVTPFLDDLVAVIGHCKLETIEYLNVPSYTKHTLLVARLALITRHEAKKLADLPRRTLDYLPEKRLSAEDIANHTSVKKGGEPCTPVAVMTPKSYLNQSQSRTLADYFSVLKKSADS